MGKRQNQQWLVEAPAKVGLGLEHLLYETEMQKLPTASASSAQHS